MFNDLAPLKLVDLNYQWAERWVRHMKLEVNLSPGSIRKRVQAVARAIDWHLRKSPDSMVGNPLRMLPRGYSIDNAKDAREVEALGKTARIDIQRDRRLLPSRGRSLARKPGSCSPSTDRSAGTEKGRWRSRMGRPCACCSC
jgi:hypothetical protein